MGRPRMNNPSRTDIRSCVLCHDAPPPAAGAPEIRAAVAQIAAHIGSDTRVARLLDYLVEEELSGSGDVLDAYTIALGAFGRDADFDPGADALVRADVHRLRRALDAYDRGPGALAAVQISLPAASFVPVFTAREPSSTPVATREALSDVMALFTEYKHRQPSGLSDTSLSYERVLTEVEWAWERHPDDARLTACLASLCVDGYTHFYGDVTPLARGAMLMRRALSLDPDEPECISVAAYAHFAMGHIAETVRFARALAERAPRSRFYLGSAGLFLALAGEWEEGLTHIEAASRLGAPDLPWSGAVRVLDALRRGDDQAAVEASARFDLPQVVWSRILRAVALFRVGATREAARAVSQLAQLAPRVVDAPATFVGRFILDVALADRLVSGLQDAANAR